jgi:hypothetical protein
MAKKKKQSTTRAHPIQASCHYCGASVGEISQRTEEQVYAIYDLEVAQKS